MCTTSELPTYSVVSGENGCWVIIVYCLAYMQTGESLKEEPGLWFTDTPKVVCNQRWGDLNYMKLNHIA